MWAYSPLESRSPGSGQSYYIKLVYSQYNEKWTEHKKKFKKKNCFQKFCEEKKIKKKICDSSKNYFNI